MDERPFAEKSNQIDNQLNFSDIFSIEHIQHLQDVFSAAHNIASIITHPDGRPITKPSNFCSLCNNVIRKTEKGFANCMKSDAVIGQYNPNGPTVRPCLSGGLLDGGVSITVGGVHIANWLIGQVRITGMDVQRTIDYADTIGADKDEYLKALKEVPVISSEQFMKISEMLFAFANELSENAYHNLLLERKLSELDKAYALLREKEEQTKHISSTIIDISYSCKIESSGNISFDWITGAAERITGYSTNEILEMGSWGKLVFEEDEHLYRENVLGLLPGKHGSCELRIRHKDSTIVWVESFAECSLTDDVSTTKLYGALVDITIRKQAEFDLKENEARLLELNATKDKFFSIIAHDLKGPFNSIVGFSSILEEQMQHEKYEGLDEYARIIHKSAIQAVGLLTNLLEWSRSQTGKVEFLPEYVGLTSLVDDVLELLFETANQKQITIEIDFPRSLIIFADQAMMGTILRNLISNAIKFTREGGKIHIFAEQEKDEIKISVRDNGVGIEKKHLDRFFNIGELNSHPLKMCEGVDY